MTAPAVELAPAEAARLAVLEHTVEKGLATFVEVGTALFEINDSRLYRASHGTFASYAADRFGIGRAYAYRMINAAKIAEVVSPMGDIRTERQARALKGATTEVAQASVAVAQGMAKLLRGPQAEPTAEEITEARSHVAAAPIAAVENITPERARNLTDRIVSSVQDLPEDESWAETIDAELRASDTDYRATAADVSDAYRAAVTPIRGWAADAVETAKVKESYNAPTPAPRQERRSSLVDSARNLNVDVHRILNRLTKLRNDDRLPRNAGQVASVMEGNLSEAIEVCQDLLDALTQHKGV